MDILHPLATIDWQECPGCELPPETTPSSHVVTIKDKLYVSVVDYQDVYDERYLIYSTSNTFNSWTVHDPPASLEHFGLTSYHSQLLVVGGKERGKVTNKVWTSDDATVWQSSLPPMPTVKIDTPLATNAGLSPECVIVAGKDVTNLTVLDVLLEGQWFTVPTTLQRQTSLVHVSVHNGLAYFNAATYCKGPKYLLAKCPLESLLAVCMQSHDKSHGPRLDMQLKQISLSTTKTDYRCFGQIITCSNQLHILHEQMDRANTPAPDQFVYASDLPQCVEARFVTTLYTNEFLVATCACYYLRQWKVAKGSIKSE